MKNDDNWRKPKPMPLTPRPDDAVPSRFNWDRMMPRQTTSSGETNWNPGRPADSDDDER